MWCLYEFGLFCVILYLYKWYNAVPYVLNYTKTIKNVPDLEKVDKGFLEGEAIGFDIYNMEFLEKRNGVYFYDTGIQIEPPDGFYFEIIPASSIAHLEGWVFVNSIGIIPTSYRGSLLMALTCTNRHAQKLPEQIKIAKLVPRRKFPFRAFQRESFF